MIAETIERVQGAIESAVDALLRRRESQLATLAKLDARAAKVAASWEARVDAAEVEAQKIRDVLEAPDRLRREAKGDTDRIAAEVREVQAWLEDASNWPRPLRAYRERIRRLHEAARVTEPPDTLIQTDPVYGAPPQVLNPDELARWLALGPLLVKHLVEIRDVLWRLDADALERRLRELREELDEALENTPLASA